MFTDEDGKIIAFSDMDANMEQNFVEHFERFGANDYRDNRAILSDEDFDGAEPLRERIDVNINDWEEFEDADEETIQVARAAYIRGWKRAAKDE